MKIYSTVAILFVSISSIFAQKTYIPDDGFEQALIFEGLDTVLDDSITTSIIDTLTFLDLEPFGIVDLTGIEDFSALEVFICRNNNIQQVDLSNNPSITFLNCENNSITSIDVTNCSNLNELRGENNNLTGIDLTQNTLLEALILDQNGLGAINLSNNTALKTLRLVNTSLTSINLSNNSLLEELILSTNQLTVLDVTNMPNLGALVFTNNSVIQLDLSNNPILQTLLVAGNELTDLDLQYNPLLTFITCMDNDLSSLTLPPVDPSLSVNCGTINNPNLYCITSDDPSYVLANWNISTDSFTQISTLCNVGIEENEASIEIFPNPVVDGMISINSDASGSYQLINLNGQILNSGEINQASNVLDFTKFSAGIYVLRLELNKQIITRQIELF